MGFFMLLKYYEQIYENSYIVSTVTWILILCVKLIMIILQKGVENKCIRYATVCKRIFIKQNTDGIIRKW